MPSKRSNTTEVVQEFRRAARTAFAFLVKDYGFTEASVPEEANPFSIRLTNSTTHLVVEGINWGKNARVAFGRAGHQEFDNYDLEDVLTVSCPHLRPTSEDRKRGQLEQLTTLAAALRECDAGIALLRGDFTIIPELDGVRAQRARQFGPSFDVNEFLRHTRS
jgi:hypothetical protein